MEKSSPGGRRGRDGGDRKRSSAGVWVMGALARWMLGGIKRERQRK